VIQRRKWVLILVVLLVPTVAVLFSVTKPHKYQASAQVLLNQQNAVGGLTTNQGFVDPSRAAQTEAELARVPAIADRVVSAAHVAGLTSTAFLKQSSVTPSTGSDFLTFRVTDASPVLALQLVKLYARTFTDYRLELDTATLQRGRQAAARRLAQLDSAGLKGSALYKSVALQERQLSTLLTLQQPSDVLLPNSNPATAVSSHAVLNGIIGLTLGLMLGLVLVFVADGLDTRVRTVEEVRKRLGLRVLGRVPPPARQSEGLAMLRAPMSDEAEAFRVLRASLDVANTDDRARTIMVTSADAGEGKSTTVANLAIAFARAGRRVVLIDSDLRGPSLHRLFGLNEVPGFVDVELGDVKLDEALQSVPIAVLTDTPRVTGDRFTRREGSLAVLAAGQHLHDPDELEAGPALARILDGLRERADLVLVDAGGLLALGDSLSMSPHVDALLLVVRLNALRTPMLDDLARVLSSCPAETLGFVVTGMEQAMPYGRSERYTPPEPKLPVQHRLRALSVGALAKLQGETAVDVPAEPEPEPTPQPNAARG
jgi:Mrp family chromosome partitioning ATPase